jgi:hypothetical protein
MNYDLTFRLQQALASCITDGTEGHAILEELAAAVRDANGDPVRFRNALLDAKTRQRALNFGHVHVDAAINTFMIVLDTGEVP